MTRRATPFAETRRHHSSETAEDYTELIAELTERDGIARVGTLAKSLGVSHVTALRTIQRLVKEGLVTGGNRQPISLTPKGLRTALVAKRRHELLVNFLLAIGVPRKVAEVDVEGAEHHFSARTIKAIEKFLAAQGKIKE